MTATFGHYRLGLVLMGCGAIVALAIASFGYWSPASGITATKGALLVCLSAAALLVAAVMVPLLSDHVHWLVVALVALSMVDIMGTAVAGYFLDRPVIVGAMAAAALGLALHLFRDGSSSQAVGG